MFYFDDRLEKKKECKFAIPSDFFIKIPSRKEKISYTIVSLIMHDGTSFGCGNYSSGLFDFNTGVCWHCGDDEMIYHKMHILDRFPKNTKIHICQDQKN